MKTNLSFEVKRKKAEETYQFRFFKTNELSLLKRKNENKC